jgi:hypothetical protein
MKTFILNIFIVFSANEDSAGLKVRVEKCEPAISEEKEEA